MTASGLGVTNIIFASMFVSTLATPGTLLSWAAIWRAQPPQCIFSTVMRVMTGGAACTTLPAAMASSATATMSGQRT